MTFINITYIDGKEYSYMVPRIHPDEIKRLEAHPGVKEVKVRGKTK